MAKDSISMPYIDASDAEGGLNAVASSVADVELRRQLELVIQRYKLRAAARHAGHTIPGTPIFAGGRAYAFGPFRLFPSQRLLLEGGKTVEIGSRAFDILTVLVEHAGEIVCKHELISHVWPNVFVHDSNLKTQVSGLRRTLGEGRAGRRYIVTVSGRGYNFVAPVTLVAGMVPDAPDQDYPHDRRDGGSQRQDTARVSMPSELMHV